MSVDAKTGISDKSNFFGLQDARQMKALAKADAPITEHFEILIRLQAVLNRFDIKYRHTSIATRAIGVRGKSLPGSHP